MLDLGTAVGYLMLDTSGFTSGFNDAKAGMNSFLDKSTSLGDKLKGLGSTMSSIGGTLTTKVTLPLIGIGTAAMKVGNDFEAQMSRVQAIAGATGDELDQLTDLAMQLGADTSFSASEAAEGMENLASAGFTVNEIMGAMPGLLDLAASSGADLARSTEIAASAIRGFGLDASDATHVADVFAEAAARTNAQTEDMGEAMKYIAPVANAMGQSLEMTAAAVGILSDAGIKGSQAGTALRGALSRLARPSDVAAKKMGELGLSFYDSEGNMLSLVGIVEELETKLSGLTQEQRNNALVAIFGQEALSGILALMERGSGELASLTESFENVNGSAKAMSDVMLDNTSGAIEAMSGSIETLGIKLQQVMAPTVKSVVESLTGMINSLSSMDDSTLQTIVSVTALVAALGPLMLIGGKILSFAATVGPFLASAGTSISALLGPIGLVVAGVAALEVAWVTDFGNIQEFTSSAFNSISQIVQNALGLIRTIWETNFLGIQTYVQNVFAYIESILSSAFAIIQDLLAIFSAAVTGDWASLWENVKQLFSDVWTAITSLLSSFLNLIVETVLGIAVDLIGAFVTVWTGVETAVKSKWNDIVEWFKGAINDPVGTVLSIGQALYDAGASIFNSLFDGLKSVWDNIKSWVQEKVDWIADKAKFWTDKADEIAASDRGGGFDRSRLSGSYASGLDYVPRDMNVRVHEGESIWTKQQTAELANLLSNAGQMGGGDMTINFVVNGRTFSRAIIQDFRAVDAATPKVVSDF